MKNNEDYFNLKQIEKKTDLKYRQLQNRLKKLLKESDSGGLIFKSKNRWNIHKSLIDKFYRISHSIPFSLFITIASRNNLSYDYWKHIIHQINKEIMNKLDKYSRTKYVIEMNSSGNNHLHFSIGFSNKKLIKQLLVQNEYLVGNDMNVLVKNVYDVRGLNLYFRKERKPILIKLNKKQRQPI